MSTSSFSAAPYPGLRPFEVEESDIFFGRENQTDDLLDKLHHHRFLAVIGPSGCGKSSLVRAGLISALETGFMARAGLHWRVAHLRPGDRPMRRLAQSLLTPSLLGPERMRQPDAALFLEAALRRGPLGLIEVAGESGLCRDGNLLVLVDQFEEVFRFRSQGDPEEADAFVALLLASAASSALPIYVILTMRSDFLGDCSLFRDLPEAINRSAYLIPRLTRDECAAAIKGPARVFNGEIEPALVNRLLNDFGPDPDQLPLLQHALMRMWYQRTHPPAATRTGSTVLTIADYEQLGGLTRALSDHADEAMRELTPDQQRLAKIIFQRLTERGSGKRDTRAPARLADIARVAGATVPEVAAVIDAFRHEGRCFLTPLEGPLEPDRLIDIGHESLIRQWKQLAGWVDEEADSSRMYSRLRDTAALWEADQAGLWSNPDLARAVQWRQRTNPTESWASRYGQPEDFARAMKFLAASEAEQQARERDARLARERALRHARRVSIALAAVILAIVAGLLVRWYGWERESSSYFAWFAKVDGVPTGIGPLSASQVRHRESSLKIVRKGRFGRVRRVEAVDQQGRLTARHQVSTYLADSEPVLQRREVKWEFLYDDQGRVAHEVAYDREGHRVWGLIYSPTIANDARVRLAHFVGPEGYPRQSKEYGAGYVRIEYTPEGYESSIGYLNALGEPRPGIDRAFGRRLRFDAQGRLLEVVSIGPDGKPMIDEAGNAGMSMTPDAFGNAVEYVATDAAGAVTTLRNGYAKAKASYDANGNQTELAVFDEHGQPTLRQEGYHRITKTWSETGTLTEQRFWDISGAQTLSTGCHGLRYEYDARGNMTRETCLGIDGRPAPGDDGRTVTTLVYDDHDNLLQADMLDAEARPVAGTNGYSRMVRRYDERGNEIAEAFFGTDGRPVTTGNGYSSTASRFDAHNNEIERTYFGIDGKPVAIAVDPDRDDFEGGGRPVTYARLRREYESGHLVSVSFFDVNDKPMLSADGYASWRATFDRSGNRIEVAYFGLAGEHVKSIDGYAGWRSLYDALGRRTKVEYFGERGEPVLVDGRAGYTIAYDAQGNQVETTNLDRDGKPVVAEGYASLRRKYDRRGNAVEYLYLDAAGQPLEQLWRNAPKSHGYARETRSYDERKRLVERVFYGANGARVATPEGWSRVTSRYDLRGSEPVERAYFDTADRPSKIDGYHATKRKLDAYGRVIEVTYFDENGKAARTADGYAKLTNKYDSYGHKIEQSIFGENGAPIADETQIHRITLKYDDRGRQIELRFFGVRGNPIRAGGVRQHMTRYGYDTRGLTIEIANFDVDGTTPALGPDLARKKLCTRWTGTYDADGKLVPESEKCVGR